MVVVIAIVSLCCLVAIVVLASNEYSLSHLDFKRKATNYGDSIVD